MKSLELNSLPRSIIYEYIIYLDLLENCMLVIHIIVKISNRHYLYLFVINSFSKNICTLIDI